ncbi:MAG: magnesium transporter CorA family protein [Gammaproteobacteria bacterium]|nr:magnesium transporter CorA family protein [Gammaproteobacteria bacterium]
MDILSLVNRGQPKVLDSIDKRPTEGFIWLDFVREEARDWASVIQRIAGITVHEHHVRDSLNPKHPSYADSTQHYEMVIFRGLSPQGTTGHFETRPTVFFLFDNLFVTIRPADSLSIKEVRKRLLQQDCRIPTRPAGLMHLVLSAQVERFMAMREPMAEQLVAWRRDLLDPSHPFDDWMTLMNYGSQLRKMQMVFEEQDEAVTAWRDDTDIEIDDHLSVRLNDLIEHIRRVSRFTADHQHEVESLVNLHFSAVAHRTNEIMRVLTVLSAIFLPLSLIAGIFGMNFDNMPELHYQHAYFFALGGMVFLAIGLLVLFRIKRWF